MTKPFKYWKTLLFTILTLVLFLMPTAGIPKSTSFPGVNELAHIILFAILTIILLGDVLGTKKGFIAGIPSIPVARELRSSRLIFPLFILLVYGVLIEFLQEWMNMGRTAEIKDLLYDAVGIILGFFVLVLMSLKSGKA